jgi:hypothetical protein
VIIKQFYLKKKFTNFQSGYQTGKPVAEKKNSFSSCSAAKSTKTLLHKIIRDPPAIDDSF